ncbi:MAG: DNA cytosine methyltransferase [Pseudomonadota bacterium]
MRTQTKLEKKRATRGQTPIFFEFFAGGGMARIGLGDRWRCAFANDFDPKKCAAYRANFGGKDLVETDIATLTLDDLPDVRPDLVWASFPCQDLSLAGARGGITASRSGAFFPFWRLVEGLIEDNRAPKLIVLENVAGLLTSNGGGDFAALAGLMTKRGYKVSTCVIDASQFTPQSRPRLFILGFGPGAGIPADTIAAQPPPALEAAIDALPPRVRRNVAPARTPHGPRSNIALKDIVDWNGGDWHPPAQTRKLIAMMNPQQRRRLKSLMNSGKPIAGTGFRRMRTEKGKTVQRFEARFDGLAGCLRTPAGGSSRQVLIAIENGKARTRLLNAREAARLMGLPDDYVLPENANAALKLCGDGVCPPVVQWLAAHILEPALFSVEARAAA